LLGQRRPEATGKKWSRSSGDDEQHAMSDLNSTATTAAFVMALNGAYFVLLALTAAWIWTALGGAVLVVLTIFFVRQILGGKM
jgi:hypothetical protein